MVKKNPPQLIITKSWIFKQEKFKFEFIVNYNITCQNNIWMFFGLNEFKHCENFCTYIKSSKLRSRADSAGLVRDRQQYVF